MIKHVLKDGRQVEDISGHVIRMKDFETVYNVIENINRKRGDDNDKSISASGRSIK